MIDIENQIYTKCRNAILKEFPNAFITGIPTSTPAKFPAIYIEEKDNMTFFPALSTSADDGYAIVLYEVNIYSNDKTSKKSECKFIRDIVDNVFLKYNFTRLSSNPVTNYDDSTIYRIVSRYRAVVGKDSIIYRRY